MSDTIKEGKRYRIPSGRPRSSRQSNSRTNRHAYGRTEKILRRNRKIWTRLFAKQGRQLDKQEIKDQQ